MKINLFSKALLMGGMLAMVACSNDEPVIDNGNNNPLDGDVAYMKVRIQSADRMSRSTTDGDYAYGAAEENDVKNVRFFFFDDKGAAMDLTAYLVKADSNVDINRYPHEDGKVDGNVEAVFAENLLVLEKLTSNEYPNYMLTVLNAPSFECGTNLTNTLELLDNYQQTIEDTNYFVMSTSSFSGEKPNHDDNFYHATKLNPTDFKNTPDDAVAENAPVEVYVERLAAKVEIGVALTDPSKAQEVTYKGETFTIYALEQTVANGNGGDNVENDPNQLSTKLYLRVHGWNINTTANNSYMSKNIDLDWKYIWQGKSWNNAGDYRCFWAKSTVYGDNLAAAESKLSYVKSPNLDLALNTDLNPGDKKKVAYCNENTNVYTNLFGDEFEGEKNTGRKLVNSQIVTNVVLSTQIVDETGAPVDMVKANGVLFRQDAYMQYIINRAYVMSDALNIYVKTTPGEEEGSTINKKEYEQIGLDYFSLVRPSEEDYEGVGDVDVELNDKIKAEEFANYYYFDSEATGTSEDPKYKVYASQEDFEKAIATAKDALAEAQPKGVNHAEIFNRGYNVYYIPVEHLAAETGVDNQRDGYYGVVRNHWYKLTINSFSKVGHGIWDPATGEEVLKPGKPEDPLYYLGAHINILSWKVVNQGVEL